MRALPLVALLIASVAATACSTDTPKKKKADTDASAYDGSTDGGGTGGTSGSGGADASAGAAGNAGAAGSAGADASAGAAGVAGAAGADAGLDATVDADASTVCAQGTVKDLVSGTCLACPADGGSDAGSDPYQPVLDCAQVIGAQSHLDPATGQLAIQLDYPLQVDSVAFDVIVYYTDPDGGFGQIEPTGTLPVTGNTISVDLSALVTSGVTVLEIDVMSLTFTDACGRTSVLTLDCSSSTAATPVFTPGDGGVWLGECLAAC